MFRFSVAMSALACASPVRAQVPPCPPLFILADVEDLQRELIRLAERGELSMMGTIDLITSSVVPRPPCTRMAPDQDPDELLREMVTFAFETNTVEMYTIAAGTSYAVRLLVRPLEGEPPRPLPLDALTSAIANSDSTTARVQAIATLANLADHPGAQDYLLEKMRVPGGSPEPPEFPEELVRMIYRRIGRVPVEGLLQRFEAEPDLIGNARVRCWVENGGFPLPERPIGADPLCP